MLNTACAEPFYQQIINQVRNLILSGGLLPGTALPSVRSLSQQLTVSVITTRRAYEELERDGLIYTRAGMGSFVAETDTRQINEARSAHIRSLLMETMQEAMRVGLPEEEMQELAKDMLAQMRRQKASNKSSK